MLFLATILHLLAFLLVLDLLDFGTCNASYLLLILTEHMQQITLLLLQFKLKLPYLLLLLFHFLSQFLKRVRFRVLRIIRILQINNFLGFLATMAFRIGKFDFNVDGATFNGEKWDVDVTSFESFCLFVCGVHHEHLLREVRGIAVLFFWLFNFLRDVDS